MPPDELRLRRARDVLNDFGALWREPAVPDRLREEAVHEMFVRFDIEGPTLVAAHAQPNENAWLLGQALLKAGLLPMQQVMGLVGARGLEPTHRRHRC
jgi:hypothetical protein